MLDQRSSYECTIVASMPETRTAIDETGRIVSWVADDALTVIYADPGTTAFTASRFYYSGANNAFKGNVRNAGQRNDWYLLYPYREDNVDATQMHITVQNDPVQDGNDSPAHLCGEFFPLYGKALDVDGGQQGLEINVSHALAYIKYSVYNTTDAPIVVKNIVFAAPVPITGAFVGDLTAQNLTWTPEASASKNLTLTVNNGTEIATGEESFFYAGSIPFTLEAGSSVKVKVTAVHPSAPNTEIYFYKVISFSQDSEMKPGVYKTITLPFDETHQTDPGDEGPVIKQDQSLSFANETLTWTLGDVYALNGVYNMPQEVAGAQTTVTYASSKPEVIDITDDGKFMIKGLGTTTITASAAESEAYNPAEKSYTLTVAEAAVVPTSRTYTYVAPGSLSEGTYLITGSESNELSVALFPNVSTGSWNSQVTGQVNNGQFVPHKVIGNNNSVNSFTSEDAEVIASEVELIRSGNGWRIQVKSTGKYLVVPTQEYRINYVDDSSSATAFSVSSGSSGATVQSGSYYFYHSGSAGGFTFRTSSTGNTRFYKLDATKQNQTIAFANPSVTWTLGDTYAEGGTYSLPQASGAVTTVTYDSSNRGVAEIVNNNQVKINGTGSTTITASAAETSSYYGATATMTLVIENGTTPTPTGSVYKRVEASDVTSGYDWSGTYLFVDETSGKAFAAFSANANSGYAVNVTITNGQIAATSDIAKYALTVTDAGVQHANVSGQEAYDVRNSDGKYIYYSSSALQISDTNTKTSSGSSWGGSSTTTAYYHAFKYDNGVQVLSSGHSSGYNKYYLGYASNAFSYSNESADGRRVQLYKLTEGTTPTPGKLDQTLTFAEPTVTRTMETASGTLAVQNVQGAQTSVTYSSSDTDIADVSGTTITIKSFGSVQIIATAASSSTYNSATTYYTLNIQQASSSTSSTRTYTYQSSPSAGTYLLGGYESSGSQYSIALFPTVLTGNWSSSQGEVTNGQYVGQREITSENTLTYTDDTEIFNAEVELIASGSNWKIKVKSTGQYLTAPTQDNRVVYTSSESSAAAFSISGGSSWGSTSNGLGISSGSYYLYHSGSAHGFSMRAYQVTNMRLYKLTSESGTSGKQNQNPYFASSAVTETRATASGTLQVQAVQGAQGTVTYESSDETVATVSGTTITIKKFGTTIITARAAGNTNYNPGSASYTLTISQSGSTPSTGERTYTYTAPNNLEEGTYVIAGSETSELSVALFPNVSSGSWNSSVTGQVSGQFIPHKVIGTNNSVDSFTSTDSDVFAGEVKLVKNGNYWRFQVNNNQYLSAPSAEYQISFGDASSAANFSISSGSNGATIQTQTGGYYFYHSGSADGFTFRTSSTANIRFYKLTAGGGDPDKQNQNLSFAESTQTYALEQSELPKTVTRQDVQNAHGEVTYRSDNTGVATVSGSNVTLVGYGEAHIYADAKGDSNWNAASKYYTITVKRASQTGVWNLENTSVSNYFDAAYSQYTQGNHSSTSVVSSYARNVSQTNRLDWPAPATVTWTSSSTGTTLSVYYDAAHTNEEIMAVAEIGSNTADIYNLIPNKHYYWVLKNGNTTVASGEFDTEGRRRMVGIGLKSNYGQSYANNCRDLGGQETTSGKKIKYGKIYRGTNMDNTTNTDQASYIVNKMKIGLDVDLRAKQSSSGGWGGWGGNSDTYQKNALESFGFNNIDSGWNYASTYRGHTTEEYSSGTNLKDPALMGPTLTRIFNAVDNNVNVYIHCMVGADRTGGTCLYLESILGVVPERCDIDFELTSFSCVGTRSRTGGSEQYAAVYDAINQTSGSTWQEKAINYCVNHLGIDRDAITRFQNNMLE